MADNASQDSPGAHRKDVHLRGAYAQDVHLQDAQTREVTGVPVVRLVRGNATPEELAALIAVVAVLASAGSDDDDGDGDGDGDPGQTDRLSWGGGTSTRSRWSAPARMVRRTPPHGPGGWRAPASPRAVTSMRASG